MFADWAGLFAGKPRSYGDHAVLVGARLAREGDLELTPSTAPRRTNSPDSIHRPALSTKSALCRRA
ncbi:hypothetical protein FQ192_27450 [Pseudomonas sp. ANT_J12]|nr:hypothetical protein FQ192_27450 [Pseudomonas sp. ANT_J12]